MLCPICNQELELTQKFIKEWVEDYHCYHYHSEPYAICLHCGWQECSEDTMELEEIPF